jgi:alkylation response protein AidB-like acyl-CoA dehydrogenase
VELAVAGLRGVLDELWYQASTGERPAPVQRARLRLAAAHAVDVGAHVVREAVSLVGADALHRSHPVERLARDVEMLRNHVAVSPSTREQLGSVLLGVHEGPQGFV